jgi:DNA-binding Lrp family transcriptional regulator
MRAYVLIQTEPGQLARIVDELTKVKGVIAVAALTGPYDAIAEAEARSLDDLTGHVLRPIQALAGVNRTLTCPVVTL